MEENKLLVVSLIILLFATVGLVTFKLILKNKVTIQPQTTSTQPRGKIECKNPRPRVCTMECIQNPPYICGSDGKSYCTVCQACANTKVTWYEMKASTCGD